MKRVLLVLAILVALGLVFGSGASAQKMIRIGEHQIVSHPALDNDSKGFAAALAEEGFVEGKNHHHRPAECPGRSGELRHHCPASSRTTRSTSSMPSAHPMPRRRQRSPRPSPSSFLRSRTRWQPALSPEWERPGTNITGVSDRWPITLQCEMYQDLLPNAKNWGTIYNPGDVNVTFHIKEMKEAVEKMGGKLIEAHVSTSAEVMQAAQSLVGRVDAHPYHLGQHVGLRL